MKKANKRRAAFTLLELLVVLGIMGLMAGIGFNGFEGIRRWQKRQSEQAFFGEIQTALRLYYLEHRSWPDAMTGSEHELGAGGDSLFEDLQPYMESILDSRFLESKFPGQHLLVVIDFDRDHWIEARDFDRLGNADRPERLWERVILYTLNADGALVNWSWGD